MVIAFNSIEKLAEGLGVSPRSVATLLKRKGCPGKGPNGYDLEAWKVWHDRERAKSNRLPLHGTTTGGTGGVSPHVEAKLSMIEEKAREVRLKNEERQLKIGRLNGELIPRETVEMVLGKFVAELRSKHLAVKAQAPRLAMMTDAVEIERLLGDALISAMEGVSRLPWKPSA
jgi:hypothetical protein